MSIKEEVINGITYIIETNDRGLVVKYPKYKGDIVDSPKDPLIEIKEKLNFLAIEINTIKKQTEKV
jgi:hypothetical protein